MKALKEKLMLGAPHNRGRSKLHKKETFDVRGYGRQHQLGLLRHGRKKVPKVHQGSSSIGERTPEEHIIFH